MSSAGRVLVTEGELQARVSQLGARITSDYHGRPLLLVGVLKGAFVFMSDLARAIDLPVDLDFMSVSSFGESTRSSGIVRIVMDLETDIRDRHVLLVEDIVDSDLKMTYLLELLRSRGPASMEVCALLARADSDQSQIGYTGFVIGDEFVIGYGLDAAERHRDLRSIHVFEPRTRSH